MDMEFDWVKIHNCSM